MKCDECDGTQFVRFRPAFSYRPGASWIARLLGRPDYTLRHTADVLVCTLCGTHWLATASEFKRVSGKQRAAPEPAPADTERKRPARTNDDIPWSRD